MNKNALWDIFLKTGKISDYLKYQKAASKEPYEELSDAELAEELFPECPNGEDYEYDDQDGRYSNP